MADEQGVQPQAKESEKSTGDVLAQIRAERERLAKERIAAEQKRARAVEAAAKKCQRTGRRAAQLRTRALCVLAGTLTAGFGGEGDAADWFGCDSELALEAAKALNREARRLGSPEKFRAEFLTKFAPRLA